MFLLLVLLTGLGGMHADLNPHKIFLQTTIPEKISSSDAKADPEHNVVYMITVEGKPYFVHLKKQSILSSASFIHSYDKNDFRHSKPLLVQMDCNYNGYVAGIPNSLVTLSVCSGLRGTMQLKNISYVIEPMEAVSGFIHKIYEEKFADTNILLEENDTYSWFNSEYQVRKSSEKTDFIKLFPRYIEMHIVVDKNLFDYMGSDINAVTQKVIQIIGLVNTMLTQLQLTVIISSIEIWSNKNKISTTGHAEDVLLQFFEWKKDHLNFKPHQIAYLFVYRKLPILIGATFPGQICNKDFAAAVALYTEGLSLESYTVIIVQLLGLNLGLTYDKTDTCHCSGDVCTMTPKAVYSGGVKDFSICSLDDFKYISSHNGLTCLQTNLPEMPTYTQRRICGNGLLEGGEECDCGNNNNCTHKLCCEPLTCRLKGNALCGSGDCCSKDCKFKPANTICRKSVDEECDFTEFCNGSHPYCLLDTYVRDGEYCDSGGAFCFQGRCRTFDKQCDDLIGRGSRGAPIFCYDEINTRGDKFGNCGTEYCLFQHILCGKLVCTWEHRDLISRPNLSVIYAHVRDQTCVSTYLPRRKPPPVQASVSSTSYYSVDDRDETFVQDGSVCGPDMYCFKMRCKHVRFLMNFEMCEASNHCNGHGVCNNFNHCHCEKGYNPPYCQPKKEAFGSIDDGHLVPTEKSYMEEGRHAPFQKQHFQLIFYISLPVLIITTAILIKRKKLRELCYRGETESESSVSEESSSDNKSSLSERTFDTVWSELNTNICQSSKRYISDLLSVMEGGEAAKR
ncbi:disintegrin and metalloproteinase domain-containing protein 5 [Rhinopithecus roxellana]|uniref:disintegrin and metalloproteinase domain-containing protein 5 n=1 Tax=Rhinopithecus roxellana TaxID=61622 RepID=UPI0012370C22|nr:disintegrin and metalloproteinase domain-containing protein 5 [Rhinopithecus roxellana]